MARRLNKSARASLIWGAVAFIAIQLAVIVVADLFAAEVYDPEYAARLSRLKARHAEHPHDPLLVVLGSSRVCQLFRPEQLPTLTTPGGQRVLTFNFARLGGGPVYSRFAFSRLREEGLTPDWVVIELMPALMIPYSESYFHSSVTVRELIEMTRYMTHRRAMGFYAKNHVFPSYANRTGLLRWFAASWVLPGGQTDPELTIDALGGEGSRIRLNMDEAEQQAMQKRAAEVYSRILANYRIDPGSDAALRDLLRSCRAAGVRVAIVRTPEATKFRAAYPPEGLATLERYQQELAREFDVPVIDCHGWLRDEEFEDGHHPLLSGQKRFTSRLHKEVLIPLVKGECATRR